MIDLSKTERQRRSRQLALFNSYRAKVSGADEFTFAAAQQWYARAHQACGWVSTQCSHSVSEVAAAAAALSPGTPWSKNLAGAWAMATGRTGIARSFHTYGEDNYEKARRCLRGEDPMNALGTDEALKVKQFYRSIMLTDGAVTDDRWIYRINRLGYSSNTPGKNHHRACWSAVRMLASNLGLKSYQTQALIWLREREQDEDEKVEYDPMQAVRNVPLAREIYGAPQKVW